MKTAVICADIGSFSKGNFGWWSSESASGHSPSGLSKHVADLLSQNIGVALGFECPLFVPLAEDERQLTSARPGEGSRAWSAGAGCGALATGLVEVAWVLQSIRNQLKLPAKSFLSWQDFCTQNKSGLFLWEAFVSGAAKQTSHIADAEAGAKAFSLALPSPHKVNAIECAGGVYSLVGAALLRTGWSTDIKILSQPCIVVRA
jgi:hypothetical protein